MIYEFKTDGTCSSTIFIELDGTIIKHIRFAGGCSGNLKGIATLAEGMEVEEVKKKLKGITCGFKSTSCPDQLARALESL